MFQRPVSLREAGSFALRYPAEQENHSVPLSLRGTRRTRKSFPFLRHCEARAEPWVIHPAEFFRPDCFISARFVRNDRNALPLEAAPQNKNHSCSFVIARLRRTRNHSRSFRHCEECRSRGNHPASCSVLIVSFAPLVRNDRTRFLAIPLRDKEIIPGPFSSLRGSVVTSEIALSPFVIAERFAGAG